MARPLGDMGRIQTKWRNIPFDVGYEGIDFYILNFRKRIAGDHVSGAEALVYLGATP